MAIDDRSPTAGRIEISFSFKKNPASNRRLRVLWDAVLLFVLFGRSMGRVLILGSAVNLCSIRPCFNQRV